MADMIENQRILSLYLDNIEQKKLTFYGNGNYYGYPECCIVYFENVRLLKKDLSTTKLQNKYKGGGFIPCHICCEMLEQTCCRSKDLIRNRICKWPF
jgi:hypothetical protein